METCYINSQAQTIYFLAFFFGAPPEGLERLIPLVMPNAACFGASYSLPEGSKVYNENLEVLDVQVSTHTQPMQSNTERNNWNHVAGLEKSPDNRKVLVLHVHISSCQLSDTCVEIPWSQANRKPNNFTCMSYSKTQTSEATASMVWQGSISESEKKSCNQVTQRSHQTWSALMPAHAQNPTSWFGWSNLNTHSFWQGFVFQDHDLAPKEWLQPFWSPSPFYFCPYYWSCPCHPSHPGLFPYLTSWEVHQVCVGLQLLMLEWRVKARQWRGQVQQKAGCAVETWIDAITLRVMSIYGNDESNSESLKVFQRIYNGNTWGNSWLLTRLWERHISSCTMPMLLLSMLVPRSTVRPKLKAQVMPKHNWRTSTLQCWCTSISEFCFFCCLKVLLLPGHCSDWRGWPPFRLGTLNTILCEEGSCLKLSGPATSSTSWHSLLHRPRRCQWFVFPSWAQASASRAARSPALVSPWSWLTENSDHCLPPSAYWQGQTVPCWFHSLPSTSAGDSQAASSV